MTRSLHLMVLAGGVLVLSHCGTVHSIDRSDAQAWNDGVVWKPRPGSARDFVPVDFTGPVVAGAGKGEWITDPQDGYRFYIPEAGTRKFPAGVLRAEADKATNDLTRGEQTTGNTMKTVFFPVSGMVWLFTADHSGGGGGGGDGGSSTSTSTDSFTDTSDTTSNTSSRCCHDRNGDGKCDTGSGHHGK